MQSLNVLLGFVFLFNNDMSTFVGYLMLKESL